LEAEIADVRRQWAEDRAAAAEAARAHRHEVEGCAEPYL